MATRTTPQRARKGRPTKLTEGVAEAIIESVRNGNYMDTAARAAGIHPDTLRNWRARGEEGGQRNALYVEFFGALTRAEAEAEERAVKALGDAFTDDWRAASEYLRRRHPDRWSTQDRIHGQVKHQHEHEVSDQLDREIERLIAELGASEEASPAHDPSD
jgi:transposase-like protein